MDYKQIMTTVAVALIAGVLAAFVAVWLVAPKALPSGKDIVAGAAGNLLAEQYDPYVQYNGGYNSAKDIKTSADLNTSGTFTATGAATLTSTFTLGSSGTAATRFNTGTCHLAVASSTPLTIAATSSVMVDCQGTNVLASATASYSALTGITADDNVFVSAPTTTPTGTGSGLVVAGVNASSTSGYISIKITNLTGATFTFATTSAYGWRYWATDL